MPNPLTLHAFADFCAMKGDEPYSYLGGPGSPCAAKQFAYSLGLPYSTAAVPDRWFATERMGLGTFWQKAEFCAFMATPKTFAGLAAYIRERA